MFQEQEHLSRCTLFQLTGAVVHLFQGVLSQQDIQEIQDSPPVLCELWLQLESLTTLVFNQGLIPLSFAEKDQGWFFSTNGPMACQKKSRNGASLLVFSGPREKNILHMSFRGLNLRLGPGTAAIMIWQQSAETLDKNLINNFTKSGKMELPILQRWFCSVRSPCVTEAMHWSHRSHRAAEFLWNFGVSTCSICKFILNHLVAAVPLVETNNISPVCPYIVEIWPVLIACTWKIRVLLAAFWDNCPTTYRHYIWAKRSSVMVHCARSIALLLASFDVALPSDREEPSWIDWTSSIFTRQRKVQSLQETLQGKMHQLWVQKNGTKCPQLALVGTLVLEQVYCLVLWNELVCPLGRSLGSVQQACTCYDWEAGVHLFQSKGSGSRGLWQ